MYQCPYCKITKSSWKEVQGHTNRCSNSDHTYAIHESIGPFHYTDLYYNSLVELQSMYSATFIKSSIRKFKKYQLIDKNFSFKKTYTKDELVVLLQELYLKLGKTPSVTDYQAVYAYPTSATIIKKFDTWNAAIKAANIPVVNLGNPSSKVYNKPESVDRCIYDLGDVNNALIVAASRTKQGLTKKLFDTYKDLLSSTVVLQFYTTWDKALASNNIPPSRSSLYGIATLALDKHLYRSKAEAHFIDMYLYSKYTYEIEPKYPESNWRYDWYVRELDLYVELAGGLRPDRVMSKIEVNKSLGRKLLVATYEDVYNYSSLEDLIRKYSHD